MKTKKESFMSSVLILMISQVLIKILGLIYKLYLTNREGFGDKGNAIYSSGFQIYALFLTISSIGIPGALAKLVSEKIAIGDTKGAHRIFKIAFVTFGLIGFLSSTILFLGAGYISNTLLQIPEAELTLVALSPSIFFVSISCVIKGYFTGRENLKVTANSHTLEQFFKTVLSVIIVEMVALTTGTDTTIMAAGANLATTLATVLCFLYLYKYYSKMRKEIAFELKRATKNKRTRIIKTIKQILSVSIPMSMTAILGTINKNIDSMTVVRGLKSFLSEEQAKIQYGILSGKVDTLVTLPMSLNMAFATALVPSISSSKAIGDIETIRKRVSFSMLISMLIGMPCMIIMILFAKQILELLFPNATSGAFIYQISCLGIIFIVLEQTISGALHGLGKMLTPAIALGIGVIIKFILNMYLIPINPSDFFLGGTAGAAISTVVCHAVALTIEFKILSKNINLKLDKNKFIVKPIIACLIMGTIAYIFNITLFQCLNEKISTMLLILMCVIIYILLLIILRVFSEEEIYMIPYGSKIYNFLKKLRLYDNG
ncbi:polysaccharide biosynthesis protein [Clostridium sp. CAG:567]|nr:polysaccharide biosynthesis protein [Clostridium sp. CAG:567]